jgi:hypothetical protein
MFSSSDFQQFLPENEQYIGKGRVIFRSPDGEVSGPTTIKLSSKGRVTIRLEIENYSIPPEYHGFLMPFLQGDIAEISGRQTTYKHAGAQMIAAIDIVVPQGRFRFRCTRGLVSGSHSGVFSNEGAWVEIVPSDLELLVAEGEREELWCLPLFGPLLEFRICANACWIASREPYMPFPADGYDCGIQIFDSTNNSAYGEPSAVVFGIIGNRPHPTPDEVSALIPWGLFSALEFACGGDVGSPWIELRDCAGRLSRRIHLRFGASGQKDGFPAFSRFDSARKGSGISQFLQCFVGLPQEERRALSPAMNLIRRGAPGNATVDSCIADLVKALDALCKRHGLARQNLLRALDSSNAKAVTDIVTEARGKLKAVRRQCKADGKLDQLGVIDRIISGQANVACDKVDFGIAVAALLRKAGLHDAAAMNAYYSTLPKDVTWEGLLSSIRGQVTHSGAIHVNSRDELFAWFQFARHLHDICKRVILWKIGYKGTYNASNITFTGEYELDRITPTTTVSQLGYTVPPCSI